MQADQQVIFQSEGVDTVRDLQLHMNPNAEHILNWLHITIRLTVMHQVARGLGPPGFELRDFVLKQLDRIKWFFWYGNLFLALQTVSWRIMDIDSADPTEKQQKLIRMLDD